MFCDYFLAVNIIFTDLLNSWPSVWSKIRNQVDQWKSFSLVKNIRKPLIKVPQNSVFGKRTGTFIWWIKVPALKILKNSLQFPQN